jgi:hypothetical protein
MSKSNENNPHLVHIQLGSTTGATSSVPGPYFRKKTLIKKAWVLSGLTAASATNMLKVSLKNGTSTIVDIDSATPGEGPITPYVAKEAPETDVEVAAGSSLHARIEAAGTAGPNNGILVLECYRA